MLNRKPIELVINPSDLDSIVEEGHRETTILSKFVCDLSEDDLSKLAVNILNDAKNELSISEDSDGKYAFELAIESACDKAVKNLKPIDVWQLVCIARFNSSLDIQKEFNESEDEIKYDTFVSLDVLLEKTLNYILINLVKNIANKY